MTGLLGWAIVILGPAACALAGAWYEHLRMARNIRERLDLVYAQGWAEGEDNYRAWYGSMEYQAEMAREATAVLPLAAPVAATERLPALPAVHHDGPRHARPEHPSQPDRLDPLVLGIRAEFDRIRLQLGYPADPAHDPVGARPARRLAIAEGPEVGP